MKLRTRLATWYSGVFLVSACLLTATMYAIVSHKATSDFLHYGRDEYEEVRRITREALHDRQNLVAQLQTEIVGNRYFPTSYRLYDADAGEVLYAVGPKWLDQLAGLPQQVGVDGAPAVSRLRVGNRASSVLYLMCGPLDDGAHAHLVVELGMSYRTVYKRLADLRKLLWGSLVFSALVAIGGGWFLASRSLRPIRDMAVALERIEAESLSDRLAQGAAGDELDRLTGSVNRMLARLERAFAAARGFTAEAAHELRTPLTVAKANLQLAADPDRRADELREIIGEALDSLGQLQRTVDDLLLLGGLDAQAMPVGDQVVELREIVQDVGEVYEALATEKGIQLVLDLAEGCRVPGSQTLLRRLFSNLIENAILYTPPGGRVTVTVSAEQGECLVAVEDTGPGIGQEHIEHIFDRFYGAEPPGGVRRKGAGLGLSICRSIAEVHGGAVSVRSRPGEGSAFSVRLPAHPRAS